MRQLIQFHVVGAVKSLDDKVCKNVNNNMPIISSCGMNSE